MTLAIKYRDEKDIDFISNVVEIESYCNHYRIIVEEKETKNHLITFLNKDSIHLLGIYDE